MDIKTLLASPKKKTFYWTWYLRDDWPRWLEVCPDLHVYADFDHWQRGAEEGTDKIERLGEKVHKVVIKPDGFLDWSREKAKGRVDADARSAYAISLWKLRNAGH